MNVGFILDLLGKYLAAHPDQVEQLIEQVVKAIIAHLQTANAATPPSA